MSKMIPTVSHMSQNISFVKVAMMNTLVAFKVWSESKRKSDKIFCAETLSGAKPSKFTIDCMLLPANSFWNCQPRSK